MAESQPGDFARFRARPHDARHLSRDSDRGPLSTTKSCQRCRDVKKKCSKTKPRCSLCQKVGERCVYRVKGPSTAALEARVAWLSRMLNDSLPTGSPKVESLETGAGLDSSPDGHTQSRDSALLRHGNLDLAASPDTDPASTLERAGDQSAAQIMMAIADGAPWAQTEAAPHGPAATSCMAADTSVQTSVSSPNASDHTLPPDSACRRFVDAYFHQNHEIYPFIDKGVVSAALPDIRKPTTVLGQCFQLKLRLIMAIGSARLRRQGQISDEVAAGVPISPEAILQYCLRDDTVDSIEILMLLALYSLYDPSALEMWAIVGVITRKARRIGLTPGGLAMDQLPADRGEQRRRLFWSVLNFDTMVSCSLGLQSDFVSPTESWRPGVSLPSITTGEFTSVDSREHAYGLQVARHIIQLRKIEASILAELGLGRPGPVKGVSEEHQHILSRIGAQIEEWYGQGCLLAPAEPSSLPFHNTVSWLTTRYYNLLFMLYSPSRMNPFTSRRELVQLYQYMAKYVQSCTMLLQQRQFPFNWTTLHRHIAVLALTVFCTAKSISWWTGDPADLLNLRSLAKDSGAVLEAYPQTWHEAVHGARVFANLTAALTNISQQPRAASFGRDSAAVEEFISTAISAKQLIQNMSGTDSWPFRLLHGVVDDASHDDARTEGHDSVAVSPWCSLDTDPPSQVRRNQQNTRMHFQGRDIHGDPFLATARQLGTNIAALSSLDFDATATRSGPLTNIGTTSAVNVLDLSDPHTRATNGLWSAI